MNIPSWPFYDEEQLCRVKEILQSGRVNYWTGDQGKLFEKEFSEKFNLNWGVELNENSTLQLSVDNLMDNRAEAFKFSANSPGWRPRNYLQRIPPRRVSLRNT